MTDKDTITLPREVVEQLLKMLEMVEPYADQFTDYSSTAAEWPLNLLPKKVSEAITALRTALAAQQPKQEPVDSDDDEEFTREDVTTLLLEVMDWTYAQAHRNRPMTEAEQKVLNDIRTALAAEQPSEEAEALRRDAERYRWLRDNAAGFSGKTLDAAIDAAMQEGT